VLFDAGGTLLAVDVARLGGELRRAGHEPVDLRQAFWATLVRLDAEFGPQAGEWGDWFGSWLDRLGEAASVPPTAMREAWSAADAGAHLWDRPIPGAAQALTRLRQAGLRIGVVSNSDGRVTVALGRAGLAPLLEVIVDSGEIGIAKPDPAIFSHALGPLGLHPSETWYLGDTVSYDAAAADAAGLTSWVVDHPGLHTASHPRRVTSLAGFVDAVLGSDRMPTATARDGPAR
jgi:putative hydrolase of the HAD superfamily